MSSIPPYLDLPEGYDKQVLSIEYTNQLGSYYNYRRIFPYLGSEGEISNGKDPVFEAAFLEYINNRQKTNYSSFADIPSSAFEDIGIQNGWVVYLSNMKSLRPETQDCTIQTFIQYNFVEEGNKVIMNQFNTLSDKTSILNNVMGDLKTLTGLQNKKSDSTIAFDKDGKGVNPSINKESILTEDDYQNIKSIFSRLSAYMIVDENGETTLSKISDALNERVGNIVKDLKPYTDTYYNESQLSNYGFRNSAEAFEALKTEWSVLDQARSGYEIPPDVIADMVSNQTSVIPAGTIIKPVYNADQASVSFNLRVGLNAVSTANDINREEIRKALFIFEEFYKAAGTAIDAVSELLETMARKITK